MTTQTATTTAGSGASTGNDIDEDGAALIKGLSHRIEMIVFTLHVLSAFALCAPLAVYGYAMRAAWWGNTDWSQTGASFTDAFHTSVPVMLAAPALWVLSGIIGATSLAVQRRKITEVIGTFFLCTFLGPFIAVAIAWGIISEMG